MRPIETHDLSKRYAETDPPAVSGVSMGVDHGEIYGLLGPNGSGKSTLVQMMVTLIRPSSGRAVVGGVDVSEDPHKVRSMIGVTLQEVGVDPLQTPCELLSTQGRLTGMARREARRRAADLIELVGLEEKATSRIATLSGGQRRRLDLALSLVQKPTILFLDEPTTGLDPTSRRDLWAEILRLRDDGVTTLLTTQYLEEADQLADRIGVLSAGELVEEGTVSELKRRHGQATVEITVADVGAAMEALSDYEVRSDDGAPIMHVRVDDPEAELPAILWALGSGGVHVSSAAPHNPSIDEVYFGLTATHGASDVEAAA